jgi:hypothetical protein
VRRPDAEELLAIRNGAWTYEQLVSYADELDRHVHHDLMPISVLPAKPNVKLAAQLTITVQELVWNK